MPQHADNPEGDVATPDANEPQSWVQFSLNRMEEKIDKLDNRIRRMERIVWISFGGAVVIFAILQLLLGNFDVSITPRSPP